MPRSNEVKIGKLQVDGLLEEFKEKDTGVVMLTPGEAKGILEELFPGTYDNVSMRSLKPHEDTNEVTALTIISRADPNERYDFGQINERAREFKARKKKRKKEGKLV